MIKDKPYQHLIGLTEKEAVAILEKDGGDFLVRRPGGCYTCDYCYSRVNIVLNKDEKVDRVYIG